MKATSEDHSSAMQGEVFVVILCAVLVVAVAGLKNNARITQEALEKSSLPAAANVPRAIPVEDLLPTTANVPRAIPVEDPLPTTESPSYPPLIRLGDKKFEIVFDTKTGDLTQETEQMIRTLVVPQLEAYAQKYNCDVVEVYGFTDGQSMAGERGIPGDFDASIFEFLGTAVPEKLPRPASNTELSMMRAASVARVLFQARQQRRLPSIRHIRILSGGPFTLPDGSPGVPSTTDEPYRRRVDLRLSNRSQFNPAD